MKPRLKSTPAARELIKSHEPFHASARQDNDGNWLVGFGHRAAAKAGVTVSREEAELLLVYDVLRAEQAIDESIGGELGASQRDALVSFALGIGLVAFRSSAVVRLIRKKRWHDAADAIAAWNGGGSARHKAERDLFLKDLPEEAARPPVELVIEFDHPDDEPEMPAPALAPEPVSEPEPVAEPEAEAEPEPETGPDPEHTSEVEMAAAAAEPETVPGPSLKGRSELAERVILRMQAQLSGPVRETGYAAPAPEPESETEADADGDRLGRLGFSFTRSSDIDEDDPGDNDAQDGALPPIVGANAVNADGAAGEVANTVDAADPDSAAAVEEQDDLPDPSEIDADFADEEPAESTNGWSNGNAEPAPGRNGGHLGEIILLVLGLALASGGVWDLWTRSNAGEPVETNFIGVAALAVGFIFAAGAAIWLLGGRRK